MVPDPQAEIDRLRVELEGTRGELSACRDDLTEAYSMLAKAGLDWAKERQENASLQARCNNLSQQLEAVQMQCTQLHSLVKEGLSDKLKHAALALVEDREVLTKQLDDATSALEAEREAREEEQRRRENMENVAVSVLQMAFEAKQETQQEQHLRQNAEEAALAVLKWVAAERDAVQSEKERIIQDRKELEVGHGWREYNVRVKMHEAQLELVERTDKLEALARAIQMRVKQRGLSPLWREVEEEVLSKSLASLRNPLFPEGGDESPAAEGFDASDRHSGSPDCSRRRSMGAEAEATCSSPSMDVEGGSGHSGPCRSGPGQSGPCQAAGNSWAQGAVTPSDIWTGIPVLESSTSEGKSKGPRCLTDSPHSRKHCTSPEDKALTRQSVEERKPKGLLPAARLQKELYWRSFSGSSEESGLSLQHLKINGADEAGVATPDSMSSPEMLHFMDESAREFLSNSSSDDHTGTTGETGPVRGPFHSGRKDGGLGQQGRRRRVSRLSTGARQATAWLA